MLHINAISFDRQHFFSFNMHNARYNIERKTEDSHGLAKNHLSFVNSVKAGTYALISIYYTVVNFYRAEEKHIICV